jgi:hypothetical protein
MCEAAQEEHTVNGGQLLLILLPNAAIVLVGCIILWAARRWRRRVAAVAGLAVIAGFALCFSAAWVMDAGGLEAGRSWLQVGLALIVLGIPAGGLVLGAPEWSGAGDSRARGADKAKWLFCYWFGCWVVVFIVGIIVYLGTTPPGEFR